MINSPLKTQSQNARTKISTYHCAFSTEKNIPASNKKKVNVNVLIPINFLFNLKASANSTGLPARYIRTENPK